MGSVLNAISAWSPTPSSSLVEIEGVGAGVTGTDKGAGVALRPVEQAVSVAVGIERIGAGGLFLAVVGSVIVSVGFGGIGPVDVFVGIVHSVAIEVAGSELAQIPGEELLLVAVGDAIAVGVEIGIEAVEVGPPALAVAVGVKDRGSPRC